LNTYLIFEYSNTFEYLVAALDDC